MVNLSEIIIDYQLYKTNNDLKLLIIPNKNATIISIGMFITVGSLDENDNELGIAHFLEHMMFKGSKSYPEILTKRLDELGIIYNASTSFESTEYELHGLIEYIDELIFILLDMFYNSEIPSHKDTVDIEREIILQEYNMRHDNNAYKINLAMLKLITNKKNKLYGRPIIGTLDSIKNIKYDDLINFRKKHYTDNNATIVISGNIKYDIIEKIQDIYYKVTKNRVKFNLFNYSVDPFNINISDELIFDDSSNISIKNRVVFTNGKINQYNILLTFPCWKKFSEYNYGLNIISSILTNGMTGRITKVLRENNGLSYSQHSYISLYNNFGTFNISIGVNKDFLYKSLVLIIKELIILCNDGIKKYELNKSRNMFMTNLLLDFNNQMNVFNYLTETIVYNQEVKSINDIINEYDKFDVDYINRIIKQIFNPKQLFISIVGSNDIDYLKIKKIMKYFNKHIHN